MSTELKPCPFCGGKANLIKKGNEFTKKRSAEVRCQKCRVIQTTSAIRNSLEWCVDKATEKWNNRINENK